MAKLSEVVNQLNEEFQIPKTEKDKDSQEIQNTIGRTLDSQDQPKESEQVKYEGSRGN